MNNFFHRSHITTCLSPNPSSYSLFRFLSIRIISLEPQILPSLNPTIPFLCLFLVSSLSHPSPPVSHKITRHIYHSISSLIGLEIFLTESCSILSSIALSHVPFVCSFHRSISHPETIRQAMNLIEFSVVQFIHHTLT